MKNIKYSEGKIILELKTTNIHDGDGGDLDELAIATNWKRAFEKIYT